jgi:hypothetical protein
MNYTHREIALILEIKRLEIENWQLRGALGYPVPGHITPNNKFRCGVCDANKRFNQTASKADTI